MHKFAGIGMKYFLGQRLYRKGGGFGRKRKKGEIAGTRSGSGTNQEFRAIG